MHSEEILMLVFISFVLAFLLVLMNLRHRRAMLRHAERMQVIERGGVLPSLDDDRPRAPWSPRVYLLRGMMWLFTGIAIMILIGSLSLSASRPRSMPDKVARVRELRDSGATEQQLQEYRHALDEERDGLPLGAATLGLIPIGVGLAYLTFYRKEQQESHT